MSSILEEKKKSLIRELLYKNIEEQNLTSDFKVLINESDFLDKYQDVFKNINEKFNNYDKVSEQFINENFGVILEKTNKSQKEIVEQLNDLFMTYTMNKEMASFQTNKQNSFNKAYNKLTQALNNLKLKMEKISFLSIKKDKDSLSKIFDSFTDGTNLIKFDLEGFDDLMLERGQVIGVLASTGGGKSAFVQYLHAKVVDKYKVAHFSLELSERLLMKRMIGSLGFYSMKDLFKLTSREKENIIRKFNNFKKDQLFITVEKGKINLDKIEKILTQESPDILIIDYVQKINEEFDPNSSKASVTQILNEFAVRFNALIIITIQTNDAGRSLKEKDDENDIDDVPNFTHIARMKSIADDLTVLIALKSKKLMRDVTKCEIKFITRKSRNDTWCNFSYIANIDIGEWELFGRVDTNATDELRSFMQNIN